MKPLRTLVAKAAVTSLLAGAAITLTAVPAEAATGYWAAIAISTETGNVGLSYNQPSSGTAAGVAVDKCAAGDCQSVVEVTNGCAAVAQATNLAWGWAYASTRAAAEQAARSHTPGSDARIIAWACS